MFVLSLLELSSKVVAKCLIGGRYRHLNVNLEASLSDLILCEVTKFVPDLSSKVKIVPGLEFNVSRYDCHIDGVYSHFFEEPSLHNVESFIVHWEENFEVPEDPNDERKGYRTDIVQFLKMYLRVNTLQNLKHLNLRYCYKLPDDWIEQLGELLLNLVSFSPDYMKNLKGIHHLKNLQMVSLHRSSFQSPEQLKDLFGVPNLRVLDVSNSTGFFEILLLCEGTFQNLRFVDCLGSDITETQLRELVGRHPSLESIALLELLGNRIVRGFKEDEFLKIMMKVTQKCPPLGGEQNQVTKCLIPYFKRFFPDQSMKNIIKNLDPKSPLFIEQRWAAQTISRYFPDK
uniref:FTH domain-containing protein n=1 Tax=Caenorhabditis tropicalis TaxID=1561998 RepID=A0A1I7TVL7_9PELO